MAYSTVFLSTDEGASWQDLGYPKYYAIYCLALAGTNLIAGTSGNGILVTDINEPGWKQTALKYGTVNSLAVSGGDIFEGSLNNGVERSSDNGMNWIEINDGLTNLSVNSLVISGEYLYAGTSGSGIWKRPLSEITSAENNSNTLPSKFSLDQNYPNPFNPSTTISYAVPYQSEVNISIYNSLGVLIKVLVNRAESAGLHRVIFNADNLASGVYFYKLTARGINDNSITWSVRKMLLLK